MFQDLFRQWGNGQLAARRFALLWGVLRVALIASTFLLAATAMATIGQFKADASMKEHAWLGVALISGVLLMIAAMFNITVKRGRDIGIPGFVTGVVFFVLLVMGGVTIFLTIFLALIPSETVARTPS